MASTRSRVFVVVGVALDARQEQMVDVFNQQIARWQANDGEGAATFVTADAKVIYPERGWEFLVEDGSFQERLGSPVYQTLQATDPFLVYHDRLVVTGRIEEMDANWISVVQFTGTGEPAIMTENIFLTS